MDKPVALRKHQQISRANKSMFLMIAGVSVIVGFSLVLILFLAQRIIFTQKVITEENKTVSILQQNLNTVTALKQNILVLNTNQDLQSIQLNDNNQAVQTVLDALPSSPNSTAMASSLQTKLLSGVPGVTIDSLDVDSTNADGTTTGSAPLSLGSSTGANTIGFSFSVSTAASNQNGLQAVLLQIEKSIRPFNIETLSVESQGPSLVMSATGVSYYQPAQTVQLTNKVVRP